MKVWETTFAKEIKECDRHKSRYRSAIGKVYRHDKENIISGNSLFRFSSKLEVVITREDDMKGNLLIHMWVRYARCSGFWKKLRKLAEESKDVVKTLQDSQLWLVRRLYTELSGDDKELMFAGYDKKYLHFVVQDDKYEQIEVSCL